jgi:alkanesulfonate monooxygenase SsuD/methylene tetrahydromethanopterin reductase-like flavin-dependent oxidoreductase (luciferase family)
VPVICAAESEHATFLSGPSALSFLNLRQGKPVQMPSPEEAALHEFTPMEREIVRSWHGPLVLGDPTEVRAKLEDLVDRYRVDELMLTTMVHGQADRLRSYELVAEAWGLRPAPSPDAQTDSQPEETSADTTFADSASK